MQTEKVLSDWVGDACKKRFRSSKKKSNPNSEHKKTSTTQLFTHVERLGPRFLRNNKFWRLWVAKL